MKWSQFQRIFNYAVYLHNNLSFIYLMFYFYSELVLAYCVVKCTECRDSTAEIEDIFPKLC